MKGTRGHQIITKWLEAKGLYPFTYQEEAWLHIINGDSGLVNAPTGTGKTAPTRPPPEGEAINAHSLLICRSNIIFSIL